MSIICSPDKQKRRDKASLTTTRFRGNMKKKSKTTPKAEPKTPKKAAKKAPVKKKESRLSDKDLQKIAGGKAGIEMIERKK